MGYIQDKLGIHSVQFGIHSVKTASKIFTVNDYRIALQLVQNWLEKQLKGQCHEIFASDFFHESSSPKPLKITRGSWGLGETDPCRKPVDENLPALSL